MPKSLGLSTPVRYLNGVGSKRAKLFNGMLINTVEDLLYYFPRRYEDRTKFSCISELKEGQVYTVKAKILVSGARRAQRRYGFNITEAVVEDETGRLFACVVFWV